MRDSQGMVQFVVYSIIAGLLSCFGILAWQAYTYLRLGEWHSVSVIDALIWLQIQWAADPQEWIGAHKILNGLPLSFASALAGFLPLGLIVATEKKG